MKAAATDEAEAAARGRIRTARRADLEAILALEALFPTDRMTRRSVRRFLSVPSARVLIAELGRNVVGNLIWLSRRNSRIARIYSLVVAPQARGRQLAQRLLQAMEREARAAGCGSAVLEVQVDNGPARALYDKCGYVESARLPAFYEDGSDGLRLRKAL